MMADWAYYIEGRKQKLASLAKPSPYIGIDMIGIARLTSAVMTRLAVARHRCALMLANTASNFKSEQQYAHRS